MTTDYNYYGNSTGGVEADDPDDEDDVPGYWTDPSPVTCSDCGRGTVSGLSCEQCGVPLCTMCAEINSEFCRRHPDADFVPDYPF